MTRNPVPANTLSSVLSEEPKTSSFISTWSSNNKSTCLTENKYWSDASPRSLFLYCSLSVHHIHTHTPHHPQEEQPVKTNISLNISHHTYKAIELCVIPEQAKCSAQKKANLCG